MNIFSRPAPRASQQNETANPYAATPAMDAEMRRAAKTPLKAGLAGVDVSIGERAV